MQLPHPRKLALVSALTLTLIASAGMPTAPAAPAPDAVTVERTTLTLVDTTRPTPATSTCPALSSRTLPTIVLYPDRSAGRDRPYPLLVFAHGISAFGSLYEGFLREIAATGFVVALPTFPRTAISDCELLGSDYVNQPEDMSFVITELLHANDDPSSPLYRRIRAERIAVGGHSMGAITTFGFYNSCCLDPRVDAAIAVAGRPLSFSGAAYAWEDGPPLLLIHGDADRIVDIAGSETAYANAAPPKFFLTIVGGRHVPFRLAPSPTLVGSPPPGEAEIEDTMVAFLNRYLGDPRGWPHLEAAAIEPGFTTFRATPR